MTYIEPASEFAGATPIPAGSLGRRIKWLRQTLGMSLRDLAERVGVSAPAVWKWENGVLEPRSKHLQSLADAFHLTVPELLGKGSDAVAQSAINQSRQRIAELTGTDPDKITIVIEP